MVASITAAMSLDYLDAGSAMLSRRFSLLAMRFLRCSSGKIVSLEKESLFSNLSIGLHERRAESCERRRMLQSDR